MLVLLVLLLLLLLPHVHASHAHPHTPIGAATHRLRGGVTHLYVVE
jgi:hypothetical protein